VLEVWHFRAAGEEVPTPSEKPVPAAPQPGPIGAAVAPAH
jgi:hypothetical protein